MTHTANPPTPLRIAALQLHPVAGDIDGNAARLTAAIDQAAQAGAELAVTCAGALTGNRLGDLGRDPQLRAAARSAAQAATDHATAAGITLRVDAGPEGKTPHLDIVELHGRRIAHIRAASATEVTNVQIPGGADVIAVSGAETWRQGALPAVATAAARMACNRRAAVVYANAAGGADDVIFAGGSVAADAAGAILARGRLFTPDIVVLDIPEAVTVDAAEDAEPSAAGAGAGAEWPEGNEALYQALVAATGDYVTDNGFQQVIVGLSGGLDSALVAAIAVDAVGPDNVLGVAMPGPHSSAGSVTDAQDSARRLGIRLLELPIGGTVDAELATLGDLLRDDQASATARENLQARMRAVHLMTLANATGAIVLNTGNKSEGATGYCTLGGDAMGGYAPLRDVYKTEEYELARWRNQHAVNHGQEGPIPVATLTKAPSAELSDGQRDTDTLPPYPILDAIVRRRLEYDAGPDLIAGELAADHGLGESEARATVNRVLAQVAAAEHKRRQEPVGPAVTRAAFGTDRTDPITNRWRPHTTA